MSAAEAIIKELTSLDELLVTRLKAAKEEKDLEEARIEFSGKNPNIKTTW